MIFSVRYSHEAEKIFARLDRATQRRIDNRMRDLEADPYDARISKPLRRDLKGLRSSRVGGWRIIYTVDEALRRIYIISMGPRGQVYRDL